MTDVEGIIPIRLRVGVTGHRRLPDDPELREQLQTALLELHDDAKRFSASPVTFQVVSPLGEGADRLVAEMTLGLLPSTLEVPLPFPRDRYREDFETPESKRQFDELIERANGAVRFLGPARTPEDAYRRVGNHVVDTSDVVVTIWDGRKARGEGGTGEIVDRARHQGKPLIWVHADPPFTVRRKRIRLLRKALADIRRYNRMTVSDHTEPSRGVSEAWSRAAAEAEFPPPALDPFWDWVSPYFARADLLARRSRRWFLTSSVAMFLMAAAAVSVVAAQLIYARDHPRLAWIEAALIATAGSVWALTRHSLRRRWMSYRFLAERIRSAPFLGMTGLAQMPANPEGETGLADPALSWLTSAVQEVWRHCPPAPRLSGTSLAGFLDRAWIQDQIAYYTKAARRSRVANLFLLGVTSLLFALTLIAAVLHALDVFQGTTLEQAILLVAIVFPAFGGALGGIETIQAHTYNWERYGEMSRRLSEIGERIQDATDARAVARLALDTDAVLRSETRDWIQVRQLIHLELPV